jgi:DNA polymerase III epsilon subunit-like protein
MNTLPDRDHSIKGIFWEMWLVKNVHVLVPDHVVGEYTADFAHLPTKTIIEFHRLAQETTRDQVKRCGWQIVSIHQHEVERGVETVVRKVMTLITNKSIYLQKKAAQVSSSLPIVEARRSVPYTPPPGRSYPPPVQFVPLSLCRVCGQERPPSAFNQLCYACSVRERHKQEQANVLAEVRELMQRDDWVVIDTETTGVTKVAEIIDIAIIDSQGMVVLDTLVKPLRRIPSEASRVHGIYEKDVRSAPTFRDLWPMVSPYVQKALILAYNVVFDVRMLAQTAQQYRLEYPQTVQSKCVMKMYVSYLQGTPCGSSQPHSLGNACEHLGIQPGQHRALGDARAAWEVVKKLSEKE